jgi:hypothetical protein
MDENWGVVSALRTRLLTRPRATSSQGEVDKQRHWDAALLMDEQPVALHFDPRWCYWRTSPPKATTIDDDTSRGANTMQPAASALELNG